MDVKRDNLKEAEYVVFLLVVAKNSVQHVLSIMRMNRTLDPVTYVCKTSHDRMQPKDVKRHGSQWQR